MGNVQSFWNHQHINGSNQGGSNGASRNSNSVASRGNDAVPGENNANSPRDSSLLEGGLTRPASQPPRYSFRRTLSRIQRSLSHHSGEGRTEVTLSSPSSSSSTTSSSGRRRRREEMEFPGIVLRRGMSPIDLDHVEDAGEREARRRRVEEVSRLAFTPPPQTPPTFGSGARSQSDSPASNDVDNAPPMNSMFFYFTLPRDGALGDSEGTNPERRQSTRLQRATDFIRERIGSILPRNNINNHETLANSMPNSSEAGAEEGARSSTPNSLDRPMVLVRIRQLPIGTSLPAGANIPEPAANNADDNTGGVSSVFQWTIYFVIPRNEDDASSHADNSSSSSSPPTASSNGANFDADTAVQRAFAILRAMMAGENMGYEEWLRLQEMLGMVPRGVAKELIEEQIPAQPYTLTLNIGHCCPICLEEYHQPEGREEELERVRILPCTHSYHARCIDTWLAAYNNCPLCRQPPISMTPSPVE